MDPFRSRRRRRAGARARRLRGAGGMVPRLRALAASSGVAAALLAAPAAADPEGGAAPEAVRERAEAYVLFLEAQDLAAAGEFRKAREKMEKVAELDPQAPRVRSALARLCLRLGDRPCAEAQATRAVALTENDPDGHLVLAELARDRYRESGDARYLDRAIQELKAAVEVDPNDVGVWTYLIRLLGSEGRFDEAEEVARRAAATPGLDAAAPWLVLARALVAAGQTDRAVSLLEGVEVQGRAALPLLELLVELEGRRHDLEGQVSALSRLRALRPNDPEIAHRLGLGYLRLGRTFDAVRTLEAALALRRADPLIRRDLAEALVRMGRGAEALELLAGLADIYVTPRTLLVWAQAAEQAGRWQEAAERYESLVRALDDDRQKELAPVFRLRAARDRLRAGEPEDALAALDALDPGDASVLRLRLQALDAAGRAGEAAALLDSRLEEAPEDPWLIALSVDRARDKGAEEALEVALAALPPGPERHRLAARVAGILTGWQAADLAARLLDAVGLPPDPDPVVLRARAITLQAAGRLGEAEAAFRRLLEVDPDDHRVLNDLGYLLANAGRSLPEAIRLVERALELRPDTPAYLDSLAWALHRSGRSEEALPLLLKAVQRATGDAVAEMREHLGDVYAALGQTDRAVAEWKAALGLGFDRLPEDRERLLGKIRRHERSAVRP
ncbi:MAG: hypothetical protein D6718_03400 [Acidobacteria bacterium]|nr:MAG: hypothetical protein D6718_03400 [Acidobacteriota bacterium]